MVNVGIVTSHVESGGYGVEGIGLDVKGGGDEVVHWLEPSFFTHIPEKTELVGGGVYGGGDMVLGGAACMTIDDDTGELCTGVEGIEVATGWFG